MKFLNYQQNALRLIYKSLLGLSAMVDMWTGLELGLPEEVRRKLDSLARTSLQVAIEIKESIHE